MIELKSEVRSMGSRLMTLTEQIQGLQSSSVAPEFTDSRLTVQLPLTNKETLNELESKLCNDGSLILALVSFSFTYYSRTENGILSNK
jgi:hypothetical protein